MDTPLKRVSRQKGLHNKIIDAIMVYAEQNDYVMLAANPLKEFMQQYFMQRGFVYNNKPERHTLYTTQLNQAIHHSTKEDFIELFYSLGHEDGFVVWGDDILDVVYPYFRKWDITVIHSEHLLLYRTSHWNSEWDKYPITLTLLLNQ